VTGGPDPEDDPAEAGVEDELQDLADSDRKCRNRQGEDEDLDFSLGGKLPPNHPDADLIDDLDL